MLFGKVILITGVASGIGRRTAELAAQLGADVIGVDRDAPAQPVGDFIAADLGSPSAIAGLVARLPQRMDALCNVAGVSGASGIAATLAVNFYGLRALTEALAPRHPRGRGRGQRRFHHRLRLASQPGAGASAMVGRRGFSGRRGSTGGRAWRRQRDRLSAVQGVAVAVDLSRRAPGGCSRTVASASTRSVPGPVETPILTQFRAVLGDARVDSDIDRVGRCRHRE